MMKFKTTIFIVIIAIVAGFLLFKVGKCGTNKSLAAEKKKHEEAKEKLEEDIKIIETERDVNKKEVERLKGVIADRAKLIAERDKEIEKDKEDIEEIPEPKEDIEDPKECNDQLTALWINYDKRGKLIIKLDLQIADYRKNEKDYNALTIKHNGVLESWEAEKAKWKEKEDNDAELIKAFEKKHRKRISLVIGPGFGINGKFSIVLCIGYDITGWLKL